MLRKLVALISLFAVLGGAGCSTETGNNGPDRQQSLKREPVESLASDGAVDIARVTTNVNGTQGAPVIVIEENHSSRVAQIQEAIILNRLYRSHNIKHIVLEGYLREDSELKTDWYAKSAGSSSDAKDSVAARLLQEGEINSAEFMKLIYADAVVVPAEVRLEYEPGSHDFVDVISACYGYLYAVALTSLRPEHEEKLAAFEEQINELEFDLLAQEKVKRAASKYLLSKEPSVLSADPWVKQASDRLKNPDQLTTMPIEDEISFYQEFEKRAPTTSNIVSDKQRDALKGFIGFLKQRSAASNTIVNSTAAIADKSDVYGVAVIIGAGHTKKVVELLTSAQRPVAVIRPLELDDPNDSSAIPGELYERKMQGLSLYSEGLNKTLQQAVPASNIKPKPVIQREWFEAKAELYLYTERISERVLGGGPPPPGGNGPGGAPFGFGDDEFKGKFISINPAQIKIVADDQNSGRQAVLFPVSINPNDPARATTVWVKAVRVEAEVPTVAERDHVEKVLKDVLNEMEGKKGNGEVSAKLKPGEKVGADLMNGKKPRRAVEDVAGRVKITTKTVAAFGVSEQQAMRVVVGRL